MEFYRSVFEGTLNGSAGMSDSRLQEVPCHAIRQLPQSLARCTEVAGRWSAKMDAKWSVIAFAEVTVLPSKPTNPPSAANKARYGAALTTSGIDPSRLTGDSEPDRKAVQVLMAVD